MKRLQQLSIVVVMMLVPTASALAGDIWIDKATPAPPPSSSAKKVSPDARIGSGGEALAPVLASGLIEAVRLNLLQSMLSIF